MIPEALADLSSHAEQVSAPESHPRCGSGVNSSPPGRRCTGARGGCSNGTPEGAQGFFGPVAHIRRGLAIQGPQPARAPPDEKISFSLKQAHAGFELGPARPIQSPRRLMNSWFSSP